MFKSEVGGVNFFIYFLFFIIKAIETILPLGHYLSLSLTSIRKLQFIGGGGGGLRGDAQFFRV